MQNNSPASIISSRFAGATLRSVVESNPIQVPGAPNALTGMLVESMGFPAIYISGGAFSTSVLGLPDVGLFTLTELAQHLTQLTRRVSTPIIVDADTGFGGPVNVARTVRELESAGAAAIQLEDQELPKRCGHLSGKRLESTNAMCSKLKAAVESRADRSTVIIARTDARDVEGLEQAIFRARRYVEAGADWIFAEALATKDEFRRFANAIQVPLVANMTEFGKTPLMSFHELVEAGCRVVLYPVTLQRIAMNSLRLALQTLLDRGSQSDLINSMQTRQELYDLIGYHQYEERDRQLFS